MHNERHDVYARVTAQIVSSLEQGARPWIRPWNEENGAGRLTWPLRYNGQPYSGINVLSLWASAAAQNFAAPVWMTFRQAQELGGHVRKGQNGSLVVFASAITRTQKDADTGNDIDREIPFLKGYTVFNAGQIDGLPAHYYAPVVPKTGPVARIARAEAWVTATGISVSHSGNRAYYNHAADAVQMPPFEAFRDADSYYTTLAHELVHATKHETRLARDFGCKNWGDAAYAHEELVAEIGSAFIASDLELAIEPREDHASYIASWLEVLKNDTRAIFRAASCAWKAVDYLNGLQLPNAGAA